MTLIDAVDPNFADEHIDAYFYFVPSIFLVAYVSSAVNPFVYHLKGRSMFEERKQKSTFHSNPAATRVSVVAENAV